MTAAETIVVTGATGQLGRLVIPELQRIAPQARVIGLVRDQAKAQDLSDRGVELRVADYNDAAAVTAALAGADKVLLISSSEIGQRMTQHRNVVDAARANGVKLLAYTSILHANRNPMSLAAEHRTTEDYIQAAGVPFALLRNGWYTENYTMNLAPVVQHEVLLGAAREGRISAAARADFAAAAAVVLADAAEKHIGKVYELAGDSAFTLAQYAAEIARRSGRLIVYRDLSATDYKAALIQAGVPEMFAAIFAESDAHAATDILFEDNHALSRLIGRPTTPLAASVADTLAALR